MACCLTAPSHYLDLSWFIIYSCKVLWHSAGGVIIIKRSGDTNKWNKIKHCIFSCDQAALMVQSVRPSVCHTFLPEASFGLRVLSLPASVCLCIRPSVCVCGKHLLVRAITHHPFKLGSPNLDHRCKRPWLRSLLFLEVIDLDLQGQI